MMILNNTVPPSTTTVNSNPAFSLPYIQIGLETGQSAWEMDVNSPVPNLLDKTHHLFQGGLTCASSRTLYEIEQIATAAHQHDLPVYVVYEAGAFGQKLGRDISRAGGSPVQLVARNIEYVRFGTKKQDVPKTDRIDSQRQSHIPLNHPDLPYADVQTEQEEALRNLFKEKKRLEKSIHRVNAQMCSHLRSCHIGLRHCSVPVWEKRFEELAGLSSSKMHCLENLLSELKDVTGKHQITMKLLLAMADEITANWQPPTPDA